jgi:hypothetical protein
LRKSWGDGNKKASKNHSYGKKELNMISVTGQWNAKQAALKKLLGENDKFQEAMALLLEMHSMIHCSEMSGSADGTFEDEVWNGLDETAFKTMPAGKDTTIAWNMWHITRIEDITSNILIADEVQVINSDNWAEKMSVKVYDTGNAMTDPEIIDFSTRVSKEGLIDKHGISAVFSINRKAVPFEIARKTCRQDLQATVENIIRFVKLL